MDYAVHGILQARILEWVGLSLLQEIFLTQESNRGLLHCRWILYQLNYQGNPTFKLFNTSKGLVLNNSIYTRYACKYLLESEGTIF